MRRTHAAPAWAMAGYRAAGNRGAADEWALCQTPAILPGRRRRHGFTSAARRSMAIVHAPQGHGRYGLEGGRFGVTPPSAPRQRATIRGRPGLKREIPGHQDRQQLVPLGYIRDPHPRHAGQLPLCLRLQRRQTAQGGAPGTPRGIPLRRRATRGGSRCRLHCGREGRPQRRNPGLGRGPCFATRGIRTVQPFPRPCSAAPPACAAGAPTRCAYRAGGCRCAAVRPPARCRARRHCGAAVPAAPRPRG